MRIVTVEEMRRVEQRSVELGVSLAQLQMNAAGALARSLQRLFPGDGNSVVVLAGRGNNGRDAMIAGAILQEHGWQTRVYAVPGASSDDVAARLRASGAALMVEARPEDRETLCGWLRGSQAVLDGLLGIGARGPAREPVAAIAALVNEERPGGTFRVVAVDLPSGIDADTGDLPGAAVRADYTVSLGCVKAGLLRFPAAEMVGRLIPVGIGLPDGAEEPGTPQLITGDVVRRALPPRPAAGHKGTFGRVLVVSGSDMFVGAGYLVAASAARAGCGLVTLAVPHWQRTSLATLLPEATYLPLLDGTDEAAAAGNASAIAELLPACQALVVGPGLGQGPYQTRLVADVLSANLAGPRVPVVLDADGLNALAGREGWWELLSPGSVLTPHPGEMARLIHSSPGEVNADRGRWATRAAALWGQTVVLKGAFTVVAGSDGGEWINPAVLAALGTGGTGDVLAGLCGGLLAQGARAEEAAVASVWLHAEAARRVLAGSGADRLIAGDLPAAIPGAIGAVQAATGDE